MAAPPVRYRVWVGGLPAAITEAELFEKFSQYGLIANVTIRNSERDTYAFVTYSDRLHAEEAIARMDRSCAWGAPVKVSISKDFAPNGPRARASDGQALNMGPGAGGGSGASWQRFGGGGVGDGRPLTGRCRRSPTPPTRWRSGPRRSPSPRRPARGRRRRPRGGGSGGGGERGRSSESSSRSRSRGGGGESSAYSSLSSRPSRHRHKSGTRRRRRRRRGSAKEPREQHLCSTAPLDYGLTSSVGLYPPTPPPPGTSSALGGASSRGHLLALDAPPPAAAAPPPRRASLAPTQPVVGHYRIALENIPADMSWLELKDLGKEYGPSVTFSRTYQRDGVCCGMIEFAAQEDARRCVAELDGRRIQGGPAPMRVYEGDPSAMVASGAGAGLAA